ncbi:hypothetical protein [Helicobacter pylori]|uniref:hypothetical protein n=1 Tax=Helicobacter pylori TaxID=210 RepID=UPI000BE9B4F0|nr:hypothetical protein [Helicobacter pylori]PDW18325.1 hypothetical protein BB412_02895 [Helicobacter pylori]
MKKHILSFALGSLLVSTLSAEDDGFYTSAGYQIGEAAQMVSNTKGIQQLSDNYENLLQIHSNANAFQCIKSLILIQFNPKRRKHEKTHPFIRFRLAFSFHFER